MQRAKSEIDQINSAFMALKEELNNRNIELQTLKFQVEKDKLEYQATLNVSEKLDFMDYLRLAFIY